MKKYLNIFIIILITFIILPIRITAQQEISRDFVVIENKDIIIREKPDLSLDVVKYNRLNPVLNDTFEVVNESSEFYQINFLSDKSQYTAGWILNTDVREKFTTHPIIKFDIESDKDLVTQRIKQVIFHREWNAVIKNTIYHGEIIEGMDNQMILTSIGKPDAVNKFYTSNSQIEQWTYQKPPFNNLVLNFKDGIYASYKRYEVPLDVQFKDKLSKRKKYPYRTQGIELMSLGGASGLIAYAFLRGEDGKSILFSSEHKTVSYVILSTVVVAEAFGFYLYRYSKDAYELGIKSNSNGFQFAFKYNF